MGHAVRLRLASAYRSRHLFNVARFRNVHNGSKADILESREIGETSSYSVKQASWCRTWRYDVSLEQASALAQIISALAVIASLIFVGMQVRQNTKAVRAASSQAHSTMYHSLTDDLVSNADFASVWRNALEDLNAVNEDELVRFFSFASASFRFFESSRVQWLRGQLDDEHWHTIEQHAMALAAKPGIQAFWQLRGHWHCNAFRDWFEALPTSESSPLYAKRG